MPASNWIAGAHERERRADFRVRERRTRLSTNEWNRSSSHLQPEQAGSIYGQCIGARLVVRSAGLRLRKQPKPLFPFYTAG